MKHAQTKIEQVLALYPDLHQIGWGQMYAWRNDDGKGMEESRAELLKGWEKISRIADFLADVKAASIPNNSARQYVKELEPIFGEVLIGEFAVAAAAFGVNIRRGGQYSTDIRVALNMPSFRHAVKAKAERQKAAGWTRS
jgi:hypothetical protein